MTSSAVLMGALGITTSFLPQEILRSIGVETSAMPLLFMQILGALWMGFAMINWMAKEMLIGGIYSRPVAVGNFMHFTVGALGLIKGVLKNADMSVLWVAAAVYSVFAAGFALVLFTSPTRKSEP